MFLFALLFIFAVGLLLFHIYKDNSTRPPNFPPGPPKLPTFGSYFFIKKENFYPHKAFVSLGKKYKTDVVGFYIGPFLAATCYKYDVLKEVLSREEFSGRPDGPIVRNRGLGKKLGIFFSDEQYWKDQRWFSLRHLRDFGFGRRDVNVEQVITDEVKGMIELCTSKPQPKDADMCTQQGIVKLPDLFYGAALNSVHHSLSARHFDDYAELRMVGRAADKFLKIIDSTGCCITVAPWLRHLAPEYFGWNASFREQAVLIKFARKIVKEHKETYIEGFHRDFVDVYLSEMNYLKTNRKANTSFTEDQLVFTIIDYMFPAPVTIGHSFTFLFIYLIKNPEIQENLQAEIDRVVGRSRFPTIDDRKNMPYAEATIRETIRKGTVIPLGVGRRATRETTLGGYLIPENTLLLPNIWAHHNDPDFWGDPENFRPERWIDSDGKLMRKDTTFGFGAGKRLCAGETFARNTMFLFLTGLMQNLTFALPAGHKLPDYENQINGISLSLPDYWVEAIPR